MFDRVNLVIPSDSFAGTFRAGNLLATIVAPLGDRLPTTLLTLPVPPLLSIVPPSAHPYLISGIHLYSYSHRWLRVLFPSTLGFLRKK